jgi:CTP synthase
MRYIVVTGGVISGIGKGITSSSIGLLFQSMGYTITMIKIDPYLNVDSGTMSPYEHGECFVLADGGETDLDLGNYERFLGVELSRDHNITTGRIYQRVIEKERRGDYLGATVQIVPHITDAIIEHISRVSHLPIHGKNPDLCIIEVGGTIGDIEILPFVEALQQMRGLTEDKFCFIHVAMAISNPELKTKPIQHSVATLRSRGIFPDLLVVRAIEMLTMETKTKLTRLCQIKIEDIISNPNVKTIYHVPSIFNLQNICHRIGAKIDLPIHPIASPYIDILTYYENLSSFPTLRLGIVGKYTGSPDTYLSLNRAIEHAAFYRNCKINLNWIDSENLDEANLHLSEYDGFIIPGGFGSRGISGKLAVAKCARENSIPILGICLGMQIMVVDCFNRYSVIPGTSMEWTDMTECLPVVDILSDQTGIKGGTMRLGNYETRLQPSKVKTLYNCDTIVERHRHRYEVNNRYLGQIIQGNFNFVGTSTSPNGTPLMEVCELSSHPFYIGCQYHPEYRSTHKSPHPLFIGLIDAMRKE